MDASEPLRKIVADMLRIDAGTVTAQTPLALFLKNSVSRAMLQARLRRELAAMPPSLVGVETFHDLEALVSGVSNGKSISEPLPVLPAPVAELDGAPGISCGIDIERMESLPDAPDYWEHPFYRDSFTDAEIAECVSRPSPKEHFAVRWSAKEALMKCDERYLSAGMRNIEVRVDDRGRPSLFDLRMAPPRPVAASASLSHADGIAVAVVVRAAPNGNAAFASPSVTPSPDPVVVASRPSHQQLLTMCMAGAALVLSVVALIRGLD